MAALVAAEPHGDLPAGVVGLRPRLGRPDDPPAILGLDVERAQVVVVVRDDVAAGDVPGLAGPVGGGPGAGHVLGARFVALAGQVEQDRPALGVGGQVDGVHVQPLALVLGDQCRVADLSQRQGQRGAAGRGPGGPEVGALHVVHVASPVEALALGVVVEEGADPSAGQEPADLVVPLVNLGEHPPLRPGDTIGAGHHADGPAARVVGVHEQEAPAGDVPGLGVREVARPDQLERADVVGLGASRDVRGAAGAVAAGEDPDVALVVEVDDRVVVGVVGLLVQQDGGSGHGAGGVVVVREHVDQVGVALVGGAAVGEERLVRFLSVPRVGNVVGAVGAHAAAVLVDVLIARGLVHVPDPAVAVVLLVDEQAGGHQADPLGGRALDGGGPAFGGSTVGLVRRGQVPGEGGRLLAGGHGGGFGVGQGTPPDAQVVDRAGQEAFMLVDGPDVDLALERRHGGLLDGGGELAVAVDADLLAVVGAGIVDPLPRSRQGGVGMGVVACSRAHQHAHGLVVGVQSEHVVGFPAVDEGLRGLGVLEAHPGGHADRPAGQAQFPGGNGEGGLAIEGHAQSGRLGCGGRGNGERRSGDRCWGGQAGQKTDDNQAHRRPPTVVRTRAAHHRLPFASRLREILSTAGIHRQDTKAEGTRHGCEHAAACRPAPEELGSRPFF